MSNERNQGPSEAEYAQKLIEEIVLRCPRRVAGSEDESRALEIMYDELQGLELEPEWHDFETNRSAHANMVLHFGLGALGSILAIRAPLAAFVLHALSGGSYWLDSAKKAFILRRLGMFRRSRNLMVTLPAEGRNIGEEPALRIVVLSHIDAAFTGLLFRSDVLEQVKVPPWLNGLLHRPMATTTYSQLALAGLDLLRAGPFALSRTARFASWVLSVPAFVALALNLEVWLRNTVVPGANDNLSGVAAMTLLGQRLRNSKPKDLELVLVVTGAEEAGLMGSCALARDMCQRWDHRRTVVIALDCLCHGELRAFVEGDVVRALPAPWLVETVKQVAAMDPRFAGVRPFELRSGGSDAMAFVAQGYDALGLGRVDPDGATPRHYHLPSDTPENINAAEIIEVVDFTEMLIEAICKKRLSG